MTTLAALVNPVNPDPEYPQLFVCPFLVHPAPMHTLYKFNELSAMVVDCVNNLTLTRGVKLTPLG